MTKKEILAIVKTSPENQERLPFKTIETLTTLGVLRLDIGDDGRSYVYKVLIDDLEDKDINPDMLFDGGWKVDENDTYIFKIIS